MSSTIQLPDKPSELIRPVWKSTEYVIWAAIKSRTLNSKNKQYSHYGGAGIGICDSWRNSFSTFLNDMGPRPSRNHSVDRIDNTRGYSPENCRWATAKEQASNRRDNFRITYNGKTLTASQWARELNINRCTLVDRLNAGWSVEQAMTTPAYHGNRRHKLPLAALLQNHGL